MVEKKILEEAASILKKFGVKNHTGFYGVKSFDSDCKEYYLKDFTEEEWNVIKECLNKGKTKYEVMYSPSQEHYTLKKIK